MSEPVKRPCAWARTPLYETYHDTEWGVPVHDDRTLFEFLVLEGAQAGLSWETILKKRENYRRAFDGFEVQKVARYGEKKIAALLQDVGIVRNRLKVASAVTNAKAFIKVQEAFGSFDAYICGFVEGKPVQNAWKALKQVPVQPISPLSPAMALPAVIGARITASALRWWQAMAPPWSAIMITPAVSLRVICRIPKPSAKAPPNVP